MDNPFWKGLSRGGGLTSAIKTTAPKIGQMGVGALSKIGTGIKTLTGPIGAGIAAASQILGAKPLNTGEDDKLRELGILPPLASNKPTNTASKASSEVNSITPIAPIDTVGSAVIDGNRINYGDIGNPLKDAALINSKGYSFATIPSETSNPTGTPLNSILDTIQKVKPVESFTNRVGALNTGNTTWDMNGLDKILAAKAGHQADQERYNQQIGALTGLGSAQMNAETARMGHQMQLLGEREKNAYMAPYYQSEANKHAALAQVAPLNAKADVLKVLNEQSKNDPMLKAALETLKGFSDRGDAPGYNDYAAKISMLTGKLIPKMIDQD